MPEIPAHLLREPFQKRSASTATIPEAIQARMRQRLRLLREQVGLSVGKFETLASTTLTHYELRDISRLRLGDMVAFAAELGMEHHEFISYLIDPEDQDHTEHDSDSMSQKRLLTYFNRLSSDDQELACDLIRTLASKREKESG